MGRDATILLITMQAMATVDILYLSSPASLELDQFLLNVLL